MDSSGEFLKVSAVLRRQLLADVHAIYADLHADLDALAPLGARCDRSGRCCRFAEFGHRLYLTTPELIAMLDGVALDTLTVPSDRCPFLTADGSGRPSCGRHQQRAIGCRIFFCNVADPEPFNALYELHHARMRTLCERYNLPYRYAEVLSAIREEQTAAEQTTAERAAAERAAAAPTTHANREEPHGTEHHRSV